MRRFVTDVDGDGRSYLQSREELAVELFVDLFDFARGDLAEILTRIDDGTTAEWLESPPGGLKVMYIEHPAAGDTPDPPPDLPGLDAEGFHVTRTLDIDYVAHGELTMMLDDGPVQLKAGDVVIQRATRHAWRNESESPAGLLAILYSP